VAPVGVQNIMHPDAEEATARACQELRVPMILSSAATKTIEQVAEANGSGDRWFQLYWPKPQFEEITISLLHRAKSNGFKVLVVTLDTFSLAWRPTDLDTSYLPFRLGDGCQIGFSDPVFTRIYQQQLETDNKGVTAKIRDVLELLGRPGSIAGAAQLLLSIETIRKSQAWLDVVNSGTYREWAHLEILKKHWDGPIVLKGIQTVEDAHKAIEYGVSGIIVSNHGGRQLDGAIASLDALAEIASDEKVKSSDLTLLFDSGIRTGSDILKALALGAKAVLIGRPYIYGLAIGGEEGVKHVLRCLLADMDNMLGNMGKTSLSELNRNDLQIYDRENLSKSLLFNTRHICLFLSG
jgi:lactate 2-monooxygenase